MSDLTFYTNPRSRGRIVRWMLEEVGAAYDTEIVEYEDMKSASYLAVNPMGKVPAVRHNGIVVTECAAICAYLADAFPVAGLAPPLEARGDYYRWLFFGAGPLEQAVINRSLGVELEPGQETMAGYGSFDRVVGVLEAELGARRFICGDHFTAADVYVGSQVSWGLQFNTLPTNDAFRAYAERVTGREAYVRANELDGPMG